MLIRAELWNPSAYTLEEYNKYVVRPREAALVMNTLLHEPDSAN